MSDFFKKLGPVFRTVGRALKKAAIASWSFLKTPFGIAVTLLSMLTITSTVLLSVRLYEFTKIDDREISLKTGLVEDIQLFNVEYQNESGEITVSGADGQQVIAPGASVEYAIRLRNKDTVAINYELVSAMEFTSEFDIPLMIRLIDNDENYLLGSPSEWVPITALSEVNDTDTLVIGDSAEYVFQWKWDYEGDDAYDTLLGNTASEQDIGLAVTFSVTASANTNIGINGGFMKSGLGEIVFTSAVIATMGGSLALLLVPYIKKKIAEKKALEALGGLGDSDE